MLPWLSLRRGMGHEVREVELLAERVEPLRFVTLLGRAARLVVLRRGRHERVKLGVPRDGSLVEEEDVGHGAAVGVGAVRVSRVEVVIYSELIATAPKV